MMCLPLSAESSLLLLQLQPALSFVPFEERPQLLASIKEPNPLLVIENDREAAKPVHAHAAFFPDREFKLAGEAK